MQEGDVIDGRYRVEKKIGQGGMGQVFRGHDIVMNKQIAIKVLFPNTPDQIIKRFHAEAKALAHLNHPNIMTTQHFGQAANGQLYLVMDFIKGDSLSSRIESRGPQTFFDVLPIFEKICRGLRFAHMNGVLHRDIKPSNVMLLNDLSKEDSVKLVDFGLAKQADKDQDLTKTGAAMGSPPYMSPEAVHGRETDARSDIYSLGCTLFEMMAGVPPFVGDTPFHTMMAHLNRLPPTLAQACGKPFDEEVELLVQKCMKKNPDDRFQSMDELIKELQLAKNAILDRKRASEGILASGIYASGAFIAEQSRRADEWLKKNTVKAIVIGAIVIGVTAVVLVVTTKQFNASSDSAGEFSEAIGAMVGSNDDKVGDSFEGIGAYEKGVTIVDDKDGSPQKVVLLSGKMTDDELIEAVKPYAMRNVFQFEQLEISKRCTRYVLGFGVEKLILYDTPLSDFLFEEIGKMPRLKHLRVEKCGDLPPGALEKLRNLKTLETIKVEPGWSYKNVGRDIAALPNLHSVKLTDCNLTCEDIKVMVENLQLGQLELKHVKLTQDALDDLSKAKICRLVTITETVLSKHQLEKISAVPNLYALSLRKCEISDEMLPALYPAKSVHNIDLTRNFCTASGINLLKSKLPHIEEIRFGVPERVDAF